MTGFHFVFVVLTLFLSSLLVVTVSGCGTVECGPGTVEVDGVCQVAGTLVCEVGFKPLGNKCVPEPDWVKHKCGENAEYDPLTDTCKGTGGGNQTVECKKCPTPSGSSICLQGRVFPATELMAYWAGDKAYEDLTPLTSKDNAVVKIYDPINFVSNPAASKPLAEVGIDDNGCFIAEDVTIPFSTLFAIAVDDKSASDDSWVLAGMGETPTADKNSEDINVPAVSTKLSGEWGNSLTADGSMLVIFRDVNGKGVEGVVPTFDGKPPVGGKFEGTDMEVLFFAADPTQTTAIIDKTATKTTKSGVVAVKKAEVKAFTGEKAGCTIETGLGGSTPGVLFFRVYDVTGC
jgi:hypothetical protein